MMFWALGVALLFYRKGSADLPMEVNINAQQAEKNICSLIGKSKSEQKRKQLQWEPMGNTALGSRSGQTLCLFSIKGIWWELFLQCVLGLSP